MTASATGFAPLAIAVTEIDDDQPGGDNVYIARFLEQYGKIKNSGYFSPEGVPYHSIETLIVEAPDHGHETTSEAFSFWIWLEAQYGRVTENWAPFNNAWNVMERYIIPSHADQPTAGVAGTPQYAAEFDLPSQYPSQLQPNVPVGPGPAARRAAADLRHRRHLRHALAAGRRQHVRLRPVRRRHHPAGVHQHLPARTAGVRVGDRAAAVVRDVRTRRAQRLPGHLDHARRSAPARQWKYTNAPDADARAIQAAYWALTWATRAGPRGRRGGDRRQGRQDGRLPALRHVRQVLQADRQLRRARRPARPRPARTRRTT